MFKRTAVIVIAVTAISTSLQAQSISKPVVVEAHGLAPISGGDLPASCAAELSTRLTPTRTYGARITGGYAAGTCEAADMARELMVKEINAVRFRGTTVGELARSDKSVADAVTSYARSARTTERKLWVDRKLAEVTMKVELGNDFFALIGR